jgi:hypothetical protein
VPKTKCQLFANFVPNLVPTLSQLCANIGANFVPKSCLCPKLCQSGAEVGPTVCQNHVCCQSCAKVMA